MTSPSLCADTLFDFGSLSHRQARHLMHFIATLVRW
jgi:hypothetical protein